MTGVSNQIKKIADAASSLSDGGIKKMSNLATALDRFGRIGDVRISSSIGRQISSIADAAVKLQAADLSKLVVLSDSLRPFSTMGTAHLTSYVNQLGKMPKVIDDLNAADLDKFIAEIKELNTALTPFANNMQKISDGFSAFPSRIQRLVTSTEKFNSTMSKANKVTSAGKSNGLWGFLNSTHSKWLALTGVFGMVSSTLGKLVEKSAEYNETVNLFSISMGKYVEEAYKYAEAINSSIGIDKNEWMKNQGVYKQILDSFGVVEEKAYTMSKGLTQIAYDIASFYNTSTQEALEKVRSGIAGEIEPLRQLGITLDAATLQQIAYDNGIQQNINTMTQAQKSLLRYKAIMEGANNAIGDMARTVLEPANALRVLSSRLNDFYREVGNLMIPLLMEMIPPAQAVVKALTTIVHELALLAGYQMPEIKENDNKEALENITDEATAATQAVEELKNAAIGIDELNVISQSSNTGIGNAFDLPIDVESYDDLFIDVSEEYKQRINDLAGEIVSKFETFIPLFEGFASVFERIISLFDGFTDGGFSNWLNAVEEWAANNPDTLFNIGQGIGAIAVAWMTFSAASGAVKLFSDIVNSISGVQSLLLGLSGMIGTLSTPILIVAGAIAVLTAGLAYVYATNEEVRRSVGESLNGVWKSFVDLCENIASNVIPVLRDGWNGLLEAFHPLGDWLSMVFTSIWTDMLIPALDYLSGTIIPDVKKAFDGLWNNILAPFGSFVLSVLTPAIELASDVLEWLWKYVVVPTADFIGGVFSAAWESVAKIFTETIAPSIELAIGIFQFLWNYVLEPIVIYLWDVWSPAFESVFATIGDMIGGLRNTLVGIIEFITGIFTLDWEQAWKGIVQAFGGIWETLSSFVMGPINVVLGLFEGTINKIIDGWNWLKMQINGLSLQIPDWIPVLGGETIGFNLRMSSYVTIPRFASGGYPDEGSLFIARERGAEMVGSIGGRTAVANNDQIVEAIRQGVYDAEMAARSQDDGEDIYVYLDGDLIAARVEKIKRENGMSIFSGGVV